MRAAPALAPVVVGHIGARGVTARAQRGKASGRLRKGRREPSRRRGGVGDAGRTRPGAVRRTERAGVDGGPPVGRTEGRGSGRIRCRRGDAPVQGATCGGGARAIGGVRGSPAVVVGGGRSGRGRGRGVATRTAASGARRRMPGVARSGGEDEARGRVVRDEP